ncbi:hypothetical protein PAL_GLEAN10010975 [Pteropus alecto]|uniref:Uncharacterized protein n=1 Tax=Pteropus alecto TaxID=9402 RepID=L5KVZ2_PTEAL|nr:hypothetical protein PAL_GLEAN10010975 [Pteropus alecto]
MRVGELGQDKPRFEKLSGRVLGGVKMRGSEQAMGGERETERERPFESLDDEPTYTRSHDTAPFASSKRFASISQNVPKGCSRWSVSPSDGWVRKSFWGGGTGSSQARLTHLRSWERPVTKGAFFTHVNRRLLRSARDTCSSLLCHLSPVLPSPPIFVVVF